MKRLMLGLGVALAVAVSIGVLSAGAVTSNKAVSVNLNEFNVFPTVQSAPAGKVIFTVKTNGKIEHEFVVLRTVKPAGSLLGGDHGPTRADESGAVGEIGSVKSGQTKKLTVTLKKGHYSLLCNLPGHYKSGQFVDFYVR